MSFAKTPPWEKSDCTPQPEPKKEIAIDLMENGDYCLTPMLNGKPVARVFMKPSEAEQIALTILADLEKRRKSAIRNPQSEIK